MIELIESSSSSGGSIGCTTGGAPRPPFFADRRALRRTGSFGAALAGGGAGPKSRVADDCASSSSSWLSTDGRFGFAGGCCHFLFVRCGTAFGFSLKLKLKVIADPTSELLSSSGGSAGGKGAIKGS